MGGQAKAVGERGGVSATNIHTFGHTLRRQTSGRRIVYDTYIEATVSTNVEIGDPHC